MDEVSYFYFLKLTLDFDIANIISLWDIWSAQIRLQLVDSLIGYCLAASNKLQIESWIQRLGLESN